MLASMSPLVFAHHVRRAAEGFRLLANDPAREISIIEAGLRLRGAPRVPEKIALVETSMFSEELMQALISGGEDMPPQPAMVIWQRLVELRLAVKLVDASVRAYADHYLDLPRIRRHLEEETFENLFFAPSDLVDRYKEAVVAIDVLTRAGDLSRGSGFLVVHQDAEVLVTCRHNVDPAEGITIQQLSSAGGTQIETDPLILSESHDVALALVNRRGDGTLFRLSGATNVFDTVYTLGFPKVPQAQSLLLGHRGEVNGMAQLISAPGPTMIISNLVSPGSSGCPVLLDSGQCAGMTIRWLEAQWEDERARFSAAIPSTVLREVVAGLLRKALAAHDR
jgi:hypothetical protein